MAIMSIFNFYDICYLWLHFTYIKIFPWKAIMERAINLQILLFKKNEIGNLLRMISFDFNGK